MLRGRGRAGTGRAGLTGALQVAAAALAVGVAGTGVAVVGSGAVGTAAAGGTGPRAVAESQTSVVGRPSRDRPAGHRTVTATKAATKPAPDAAPSAPVPQAPVPAASTPLATPKGTIADYASPGGAQIGTVGVWYGYVDVLPIYAKHGSWLEVGLPQRPNMSRAWVKAADVTRSSTPWFISVNLGTTHMTVYYKGRAIWYYPVGVGLPVTPTPTGSYFVSVHEPVGNALYGPVILDTSAHSDVIQSWEGEGDAIIAIHGPIDPEADAEIGTTGAQVSNGCIRMHIDQLENLSVITPGTPVIIWN